MGNGFDAIAIRGDVRIIDHIVVKVVLIML